MITFFSSFSFACALMAGLCACAPRSSPHESSFKGSPPVGILGGTEVQSSDPLAAFTVGLYDKKNGSRCTGSLISSDTVLTAAHCVDPSSKDLQIVFSNHIFEKGQLNQEAAVPALSFVRHPQYTPSRSDGLETHDLALVFFSGGLPKGFKKVDLSSDTQSVSSPQTDLVAAGFGVSNGLFNTGGGILREVNLHFLREHSSTEFETLQDSHGVCSGDSGGPLFQSLSGKWVQVGVASRVATKFLGCRNYAVYTRVDSEKAWIEEATSLFHNE